MGLSPLRVSPGLGTGGDSWGWSWDRELGDQTQPQPDVVVMGSGTSHHLQPPPAGSGPPAMSPAPSPAPGHPFGVPPAALKPPPVVSRSGFRVLPASAVRAGAGDGAALRPAVHPDRGGQRYGRGARLGDSPGGPATGTAPGNAAAQRLGFPRASARPDRSLSPRATRLGASPRGRGVPGAPSVEAGVPSQYGLCLTGRFFFPVSTILCQAWTSTGCTGSAATWPPSRNCATKWSTVRSPTVTAGAKRATAPSKGRGTGLRPGWGAGRGPWSTRGARGPA